MNLKISGILTGTVLLASACGIGGIGGHHTKAVAGQSQYQRAVAYAKCMRSHGVPSWPDPGPQGGFPNDNGSLTKLRSTAAFKTAEAACKSSAPDAPPDQAQLQLGYRQLLKYSACMRSHGVPDYPDPVLEKGGVGITDHLNHNTSAFKAAQQACRSVQPDGSR